MGKQVGKLDDGSEAVYEKGKNEGGGWRRRDSQVSNEVCYVTMGMRTYLYIRQRRNGGQDPRPCPSLASSTTSLHLAVIFCRSEVVLTHLSLAFDQALAAYPCVCVNRRRADSWLLTSLVKTAGSVANRNTVAPVPHSPSSIKPIELRQLRRSNQLSRSR